MVEQVKNIIEGHSKLISNKDVILSDLAAKRLRHCKSCVLFNGLTCDKSRIAENVETGSSTGGCGCHMKAKVLVYSADCPLSKWQSKTKPLQLLKGSESWNKINSTTYTDGVYSLELIENTWHLADDKSLSKTIETYDEFLKVLNNE